MLEDLKTGLQKLRHKTLQKPGRLPSSGLYHYSFQDGFERSSVHLRLDPDGCGVLMINANRIMQLNPTAAVMAYFFLEKLPAGEAARLIQKKYHVSALQAQQDYAQISEHLAELIRPDGACPICTIESGVSDMLEMTAPFSTQPSAPYRMDLALTYRCNNDCSHCYNDRPRDYPELTTGDWKKILDRVWEAGIPHVVFTGGEPTLRQDLPELIAYAQANGQITGLNTNGRRISDAGFLRQLVDAGLDHVQITLESHDPQIHDRMVARKGAWKQTVAGLRNALQTPLYVMTNTTMLTWNAPTLAETLDFLAEEGVPTVGLNALIYSGKGRTAGTGLPEQDLPPLLELARQRTEDHNQRLIWYTPTQYCNFDPMQLELGVKGCTAALYNMCVEPDGGVIPCQSYYQPVGNLLHDPWNTIWNHDLSVSLRKRHYIQEKCRACSLLSECGGGCPLSYSAS